MSKDNVLQSVLPKMHTLYDRASSLITPSLRMTPDQWATVNREYPETAGIPGPRDPSITPYMTPFARAIHGRTHKRVVMVVSAQSGKSETFLDVIGERLDTSPVPILYLGPTKQFLEEQWEPRVLSLFETRALKRKVGPDSKQRKTKKLISGVPLRLAHGGSSSALKSDPFGLALTDEADELMANVKGAGNPIELVDLRGDTYADFVHAIVSTPSEGVVEVERDEESGLVFWAEAEPEEVSSTIWRLWQSGTRYHWAWPCPECSEYFIPRFGCLHWDKPKDETGRELPSSPMLAKRTAHLICPNCGCEIHDESKAQMNARGVYVAPGQSIDPDGTVHGEPPESWTLSYWVSGLCSPFVPWGERAARYVTAVRSGDFEVVRANKNGGFGELYSPGGGQVPDWQEVKGCAIDSYKMGEVPDGVQAVTLTCDVQQDRLYYTVRGWGSYGESWLIEADEIFGDTAGEDVWDELAEIGHASYDGLPVRLGLVDSGFRPGKKFIVPEHRVYQFCRKYRGMFFATKGASTKLVRPVMKSVIDIKVGGKEFKKGLTLYRVDTDHFKSWVQQRIRFAPDALGAWHLPSDISEDYCRQIVSEARVSAPNNQFKWITRSRNNHLLDCEALQGVAATLLGVVKLRGKARRRSFRKEERDKKPPTENKRPSGGGWLDKESIW